MSTEAIAEKVYQITKEGCQDMINTFGYVCPRCGGTLEPIETVDNSDNPTFWSGCKSCSHFDWGVEPEVFQVAKRMVEKYNFIPYSHMDPPGVRKVGHVEGYEEYYWKSQIGGACTLIQQIFRVQRDLKKEKENQQ